MAKQNLWGDILGALMMGGTQGVATGVTKGMESGQDIQKAMMLERIKQSMKQENLRNVMSQLGGTSGLRAKGISGEGELSYEFLKPEDIQKEEIITRSPRLANLLTYTRKSIASGASPEGIMKMTRPERFTSETEQKQIESAFKTGKTLLRKPTQAQQKRTVETSELSGQAESIVDLFGQAQTEAKIRDEAFGKAGIVGRFAGAGASLAGKFGYSPKVNVYNRAKKAFATTLAKAAGEVRPTDEDIKRFMGTLPDFSLSDYENELVVEKLKDDLRVKGAKSMWLERAKQKISNNIPRKGISAGPSLEELIAERQRRSNK